MTATILYKEYAAKQNILRGKQGAARRWQPISVTSIGSTAFFNSNLHTVTIGEGVTSMYGAFAGCNNLTTINFNAINCTGSILFHGLTPTTLNLGNKVQFIPNGAFMSLSSLTGNLNIPNSVISVGDFAFFNCSNLTSLTIGENLTSIGNGAFSGCIGLADIFNTSPIPQNISVDDYVFWELTSSDVNLHIPACSGDLYRNAPVWQDFNIVEETCTGNAIKDVVGTEKADIIGYYSITGQQLPQEPPSGLYIILYDNGMSEKRIKETR